MKITPSTYKIINNRWEAKRSNTPPQTIYSSSELQAHVPEEFDSAYFRYIACPICGEEEFTVLHKKTFYAIKKWQNFLLNVFVRLAGRNIASVVISSLVGRRVDFFRKGYRVAQCAKCSFIYRNPTYSERMLKEAYNKGNYLRFLSGKYSKNRLALYKYVLEQSCFDDRAASFTRRRILDIGCGFGLFLNLMKSKDWRPYGLDFAEDSIEYGRKELGLDNINVGNLDEETFEDNAFDAVSLISVAAHLEEPMNMFRKIHRVLRPGGLLLIWTVNAGSLMHKYLLGNWGGFSLNHLIFFDSDSINNALTRAGFSHVEIGYDHRLFDSLSKNGTIPEEHKEYFRVVMKEENLGEMLVVLATNGQ